MRIVMDSDCLIKLTKAGAKEAVAAAAVVCIPVLVRKETVDQSVAQGFQDAAAIRSNIDQGRLQVIAAGAAASRIAMPATKGETEVVAAFAGGNFDVIASDDRRFLRKLSAANIPFLTAATCILYAHKAGKLDHEEALALLAALRPYISGEEYSITKLYLERHT